MILVTEMFVFHTRKAACGAMNNRKSMSDDRSLPSSDDLLLFCLEFFATSFSISVADDIHLMPLVRLHQILRITQGFCNIVRLVDFTDKYHVIYILPNIFNTKTVL